MSSVQTQFAQVKTNTLVSYENGWTHTKAQLEAQIAADTNYTQIGNYYVLSSKAALEAFIVAHAGSGSSFAAEETFIDMGKELKVGVVGLGSLLTFRLVKRTRSNAAGNYDGAHEIGYAIVENLLSFYDTSPSSGLQANTSLHVKLARTG
jgi:hypothetical protein